MSVKYAVGSIKLRDTTKRDIPFLPKTTIDSIINPSTNVDLKTELANYESRIAEASTSDGIKVVYEEPTVANTSEYPEKTLIGAVVSNAQSPTLTFKAYRNGDPSNSSFYVLGESYNIHYEVYNDSQNDISNAILKYNGNIATTVDIDAGELLNKDIPYVISKADISECISTMQPKAMSFGIEFANSSSYTIKTYNSSDELNCVPSSATYYDPSFAISINGGTVPSGGYDLGAEIPYTVVVLNDSHTEYDEPLTITATCTRRGTTVNESAVIDQNESVSYSRTASTITEADILANDGITVSVQVSGMTFLGDAANVTYSRMFAVAAPNPELQIRMILTNAPANGEKWTDGETATYKIDVENTGNLTLSNISIVDVNSGTTHSIGTIAPNASQSITSSAFAFTIPTGNETATYRLSCTASASVPNSLVLNANVYPCAIITDKARGFRYSVDTTKVSSSNAIASMPFTSSTAVITVAWGDGTIDSNSTHTYSSPGTYQILVESSDWSATTMTTSSGSVTSSNSPQLYYFRNTLVSVDSPFYSAPANQTFSYAFYQCTKLTSLPEEMFAECTSSSSFTCCFYECSSLTSIPANLFKGCNSAASFSYCFYGCNALTSISSSTFDGCTGATNFGFCFQNCSSLQTVPEHLFDSCTGVTNFESLFRGCTNLQGLPAEIFRYNTLVTTMGGMFWSCTHLQSIPEDLVKYNTALTNVGAFFCYTAGTALSNFPTDFLKYNTNITSFTYNYYGFFEGASIGAFSLRIGSTKVNTIDYFCSNSSYTRTIYVPSGSTTYNTFYNRRSSFGYTVVAE